MWTPLFGIIKFCLRLVNIYGYCFCGRPTSIAVGVAKANYHLRNLSEICMQLFWALMSLISPFCTPAPPLLLLQHHQNCKPTAAITLREITAQSSKCSRMNGNIIWNIINYFILLYYYYYVLFYIVKLYAVILSLLLLSVSYQNPCQYPYR